MTAGAGVGLDVESADRRPASALRLAKRRFAPAEYQALLGDPALHSRRLLHGPAATTGSRLAACLKRARAAARDLMPFCSREGEGRGPGGLVWRQVGSGGMGSCCPAGALRRSRLPCCTRR